MFQLYEWKVFEMNYRLKKFQLIIIIRWYDELSVLWDCCEIENTLYIILNNNNTWFV